MLYTVATPIGNLEDITLRAINILKSVDFIAAEDTRHSALLLKKLQISKPLLSFHSHSTSKNLQKIQDLLLSGKSIALISDAGTPGISDPGYKLVKFAKENNIQVSPIPGATAVITALQGSGLPINKFLYLGFLPLKKGRKQQIEQLKNFPFTIVLYEAPHRIIKLLTELEEVLHNRQIILARELTKKFEEFITGTPAELLAKFKQKQPKGEFTVLISGLEKNHHPKT